MNWAYGVTTVPSRLTTTFKPTLESLKRAGFESPRLFIDGTSCASAYKSFGLEITTRNPVLGAFGNWVLAAWELFVRNPKADRYALFQDDFVTYRNLRQYLETWYPEDGYLNLYSFPANEQLAQGGVGWFNGIQRGLGAVALVFDRTTLTGILNQPDLTYRPTKNVNPTKGIDDAVIKAIRNLKKKEYVHYPSLVQHTGLESSINNPKHPQSKSFRGEDFDALSMTAPDVKRIKVMEESRPVVRPNPVVISKQLMPPTITGVLCQVGTPTMVRTIEAPAYKHRDSRKVMMGVESMRQHTTDEGWQLQIGLQFNGYELVGRRFKHDHTNTLDILRKFDPSVVVMQDKREWDTNHNDFRDKEAKFQNVYALSERDDVFKVTVLKDAHQRPFYHAESAREIGCHAWICYYNPVIVKHLATYVRPQHILRIYHSLDSELVPEFNMDRHGGLISGAVSKVYPLRTNIVQQYRTLPEMTYLKHPGYHRNGTATPDFLKYLNRFKVSICTSSIYGYALRKIIESTACGCVVITDLPQEEVMPDIDGNLVRVSPHIDMPALAEILKEQYARYDYDKQIYYAKLAQNYYDYRESGRRLADAIEDLRSNYTA